MLKIRKVKKPIKLYDINVEDNHNFFANNILVHNCVESYSFTTPTKHIKTSLDNENTLNYKYKPGRIHTCNLISLNLATMDKKEIEKYTRQSVRMLDNAIDLTEVPVAEGELHKNETRVIGVGTMGVADFLAKDKKSHIKDVDYLEEIFELISYNCLKASVDLAKERGSFELFNKSCFKEMKYLGKSADELQEQSKAKLDWIGLLTEAKEGVRNSQLMAIAPNTSTSLLCGCSASYLPIFSKFNYETLDKINIPVIPMYIKERFWFYKEATTIPTQDIIRLTNTLQKWIDTGMSCELILKDTDNIKDISDALLECFSDTLKTIYYSRSIDTKSVSCSSCSN